VVIVAIPRAAAALNDPAAGAILTAALLLAAVALRRYVPERRTSAPPVAAGELPAPAPASLVARGLHVSLGGREILRGFDLELAPGEIHALIGPNGSGKTTALRVLAGDLKPNRGALDGGPVARTFQRSAEFGSLDALEQVELAARAADPVPRAALWHAVGLAPETGHASQAQAALDLADGLLPVARVIATQAPVLAFDEPGVLMPKAKLQTVLKRLAARGHAVLVVEHDLRLVAAIADTVTVIDDGRVIATGKPDAVVADATVQRVYLGAA
jgi:branched-chain amino acid transport system permease protein